MTDSANTAKKISTGSILKPTTQNSQYQLDHEAYDPERSVLAWSSNIRPVRSVPAWSWYIRPIKVSTSLILKHTTQKCRCWITLQEVTSGLDLKHRLPWKVSTGLTLKLIRPMVGTWLILKRTHKAENCLYLIFCSWNRWGEIWNKNDF